MVVDISALNLGIGDPYLQLRTIMEIYLTLLNQKRSLFVRVAGVRRKSLKFLMLKVLKKMTLLPT